MLLCCSIHSLTSVHAQMDRKVLELIVFAGTSAVSHTVILDSYIMFVCVCCVCVCVYLCMCLCVCVFVLFHSEIGVQSVLRVVDEVLRTDELW